MAIFIVIISDILALRIWIYLVWMIWKQQISVFNNQMDPEVAKRLLKRLKAFLIVAGISFFAFIVWAIVHNVFHGLSDTEETIFFIIA